MKRVNPGLNSSPKDNTALRNGRKSPPTERVRRTQIGWSTRAINTRREEKQLMAEYFVDHDFLVVDKLGSKRLDVATVLVNPGTTQQFIIRKALEWINANSQEADITWYTPGSLIPTILKEYRDKNPALIQATQLFLFPGRLDTQIDSVCSPETDDFVEHYDRAFTYALLSANSFDLKTGSVYFHFSSEIQLQRAMALKEAKHKYLFLDSGKFDTISEGGIAYTLENLLETSHSVTLYTVSSNEMKNAWIKRSFGELCSRFFESRTNSKHLANVKSLGLRIVGKGKTPTEINHREGRLKTEHGGALITR